MVMPASRYRLRIPAGLWTAATTTLRHYGELDAEGLVYFSGVVCGPDAMAVTGLLRLGHAPQGDAVRVTRDEARWVLETLRRRDEKLIAQMHSHRAQARHSPGDDAYATSFHDGFLSVVVPAFAAAAPFPHEVAFHEFRHGRFEPMTSAEVRQRIHLVPEVVERAPLPRKGGGWWTRFVESVRRIGRKRP